MRTNPDLMYLTTATRHESWYHIYSLHPLDIVLRNLRTKAACAISHQDESWTSCPEYVHSISSFYYARKDCQDGPYNHAD